MFLYKYVTPDRLDILKTLRIRFTQPQALNDPFEALSRFDDRSGISKLHLTVEAAVRRYFERSTGHELTFDCLDAVSLDIAPDLSPLSLTEVRELVTDLFAVLPDRQKLASGLVLQKHFGQILGMLSLSSVPDSLLMWSHYGECHRGFVIEFNAEHPFFPARAADGYLGAVKRVAYVDTRPSYTPPPVTSYDASKEWMLRHVAELLLTKSPEWSYEQEWRMLLPLSSPEAYPHEIEGNVHLFSLPPDAMTAVIIGSRSVRETRQKVIDATKSNPDLAHVQLRYAHIDPERYGMLINSSAWPTFPEE